MTSFYWTRAPIPFLSFLKTEMTFALWVIPRGRQRLAHSMNIMCINDLAIQGARGYASIVFTYFSRNTAASVPKGLKSLFISCIWQFQHFLQSLQILHFPNQRAKVSVRNCHHKPCDPLFCQSIYGRSVGNIFKVWFITTFPLLLVSFIYFRVSATRTFRVLWNMQSWSPVCWIRCQWTGHISSRKLHIGSTESLVHSCLFKLRENKAYRAGDFGVCVVACRVVKKISRCWGFCSVRSMISKFGTLVVHVDEKKLCN